MSLLSKIFDFNLKRSVFADCFSTKYLTAQIFDEFGSWHVFALRQSYVIDGKFMLRLGNRMLLLRIDQHLIKTYRSRMAKSVQTILYTTKDWDPIDLADNEAVEKFCKANSIGQISHTQAVLIRAAQTMATGDAAAVMGFTETMDKLLEKIPPDTEQYHMERAKYQEAINGFALDKMKGPVEPINHYLGRRMSNNPATLANVVISLRPINYEWEKIANPAKTPFQHWLLVFGMIGIVAAVGIAAYFFLGEGGNDTELLLSQIQDLSNRGITPEDVGITVPEETGPVIPAPTLDGTTDIFDTIAQDTRQFAEDALGGGGSQDPAPVAEPEPVPEPPAAANQTAAQNTTVAAVAENQTQTILEEMERQVNQTQGQ